MSNSRPDSLEKGNEKGFHDTELIENVESPAGEDISEKEARQVLRKVSPLPSGGER